MEGTLLDQRVFEALVQRCLPMIKDHFVSVDVQLSVASLPYVCVISLSGLTECAQMVLELVHQLHASHLCISDRRLCPGNGREGPLPDRPR